MTLFLKKNTLQWDAGTAFIPACPTTVLWMAITGPRHQAVEEILPSNSIWLFGKLNRQLPWWLWSCLWVCHRVRLLMECLDFHLLFVSPSFSHTFLASRDPRTSIKQILPSLSLMNFYINTVVFNKYPFPLPTSLTKV